MKLRAVLMAAVLVGSASGIASAQGDAGDDRATWRIDTSHSELSFQIRHLVSRVRGGFGEWSGEIVVDPDDLAGGSVSVDIASATIDTDNERRDADLRGRDFFDAENHPAITFRSTSVRLDEDGTMRVAGDLTMRGVTRPVVLEGEFLGGMVDGQGRQRIGFEAETTIDRHDYGISWNRLVEGGNLLGDEVRIAIGVQAVRQ